MSARPLSKSRFKIATECPTKLRYAEDRSYGNDKDDDAFLRALARGGFQVGALAQLDFPGGTLVDTNDPDEALAETERLLAADSAVVYEAAVRAGNLFLRADILVKRGQHLALYEVKAKSCDGTPDEFYLKKPKGPEFLRAEWKPYFYDVAFQDWVLRRAFPEAVIRSSLYLVDKSRVATVDGLNQKFLIRDRGGNISIECEPGLTRDALGDSLLKAWDVSEDVRKIQSHPAFWTFDGRTWSFEEGLERLAAGHRPGPEPSAQCRDCEFRVDAAPDRRSGFDECWKKVLGRAPGGPMSFDLWRLSPKQKEDYLERKLYLLSQLSEEDVAAPAKATEGEGWQPYERQRLQLRKTNTGDFTEECLVDGLRREMARWTFPLNFIDFETAGVAIPFHRGQRPYEAVAFQFSHHVVEKDGSVRHANEWINAERGKFPNFDFVRALKKALAGGGTVFRYALHEQTILNGIARQLALSTEPDKDELIAWIESLAMVDLLEVVKRFYYHPKMGRSNSIKAVLPAILDGKPRRRYTGTNFKDVLLGEDPYAELGTIGRYAYDRLERLYEDDQVADGGAAMTAYLMMQFTQMSEAERGHLVASLLRYCELDTLAMVFLYEHFRALVDRR